MMAADKVLSLPQASNGGFVPSIPIPRVSQSGRVLPHGTKKLNLEIGFPKSTLCCLRPTSALLN